MHPSLLLLYAAAAVSAASLSDVLTQNSGSLSTLSNLLATVPEVTSMLSTAQNITILAPSNDAFAKLMQMDPASAMLAQNPTMLTPVLQYHVLMGIVTAMDIMDMPMFANSMLMMPDANVTGGQKIELAKVNGTVMAFSGFKQSSTISKADVMFDGGVIHIVESVLTIPASPSTTAVDTGLTSLAGALGMSGLAMGVDVLKDATIFAPSNAAFEKIGTALGSLQTEDLVNILEYHVLMNQVRFSTDLASMDQMTVRTLGGEDITVRKEDGQLFVNSARVITADILTSNGVIHIIDNVLNPMMPMATPNPSSTTQAPAFSGASSVADAPFASGVVPTATFVPATVPMENAVMNSAAAAFPAMPALGMALIAAAGAWLAAAVM